MTLLAKDSIQNPHDSTWKWVAVIRLNHDDPRANDAQSDETMFEDSIFAFLGTQGIHV